MVEVIEQGATRRITPGDFFRRSPPELDRNRRRDRYRNPKRDRTEWHRERPRKPLPRDRTAKPVDPMKNPEYQRAAARIREQGRWIAGLLPAGRLARAIRLAGYAADLIGYASDLASFQTQRAASWTYEWELVGRCAQNGGPARWRWANDTSTSCTNVATDFGWNMWNNLPLPATATHPAWLSTRDSNRRRVWTYKTVKSGTVAVPDFDNPYEIGVGTWVPEPDPNVQRASPSPLELPAPAQKSAEENNQAEAEREAEMWPDSADPASTRGRVWSSTRPRVREIYAPRYRQPPARRERHNKGLSRSARAMIALARALDGVSEASEVVDAVYEALPKETRDKWGCDRAAPFIDNAGQYGIDNADCKAKALWHNWHKVDPQLAVENILKNYLQDKIVGGFHKVAPRNFINAGEQGEVEANKRLNELLDALMEDLTSAEGVYNARPRF